MNKDDKLITDIKQTLDESADSIDANILSRIRQKRSDVIDSIGKQNINLSSMFAGGLVTACVMVFVIMLTMQTPSNMPVAPVNDIELVSSSEDLEIMEDLEFYEWLDESSVAHL